MKPERELGDESECRMTFDPGPTRLEVHGASSDGASHARLCTHPAGEALSGPLPNMPGADNARLDDIEYCLSARPPDVAISHPKKIL